MVSDYTDEVVPSRTYFKSNSNQTLKQWANREPRFYTNITFHGSTWLKTDTPRGEITTELTYNGNSGYANANWDAPYTGYGMRKMASKKDVAGLTGIVQLCFVWQTCTWGMLKR